MLITAAYKAQCASVGVFERKVTLGNEPGGIEYGCQGLERRPKNRESEQIRGGKDGRNERRKLCQEKFSFLPHYFIPLSLPLVHYPPFPLQMISRQMVDL